MHLYFSFLQTVEYKGGEDGIENQHISKESL